MTQSQNIFGPKGMTGPTGVVGPQGITGENFYEVIIGMYKKQQFSMRWEMKDGKEILIKDMEDSHIRNCINMMKRNPLNDSRRAWIEIFTDVQIKRRKLKLDKIKNKLNSK